MTSGLGQHQQDGGIVTQTRLDSDADKVKKKSVTEVLHEIITFTTMKDTNNEISILRVENDMVTTFFDNIGKFSDQFVSSFIEELRKDLDNLTLTIYSSSNELAIFNTYLIMLLRRLSHLSTSFYQTLQFCKHLAKKVIEDGDAPKDSFFIKHLYRAYVLLMKEDPAK